MLRKKECLIVAALLVAAVILTGRVRLRLDEIVAPFRNDFRSMLYMPRGSALKIMAAGFDAPVADALFIKAMVYYPQTAEVRQFRDESKMYVYELFDVVTDLSPRFYRAYQTGALFLTASDSLAVNRQGLKLLEKGIAAYDKIEADGDIATVDADPRWMFHSLLATTYDMNIQSRLRMAGDIAGASEARLAAAEHFRLAALSPGAPEYIIAAANGFESVLKGQGDIEAARAAVVSVWTEAYNQAVQRGDEEVAKNLEERVVAAQKEFDAIVTTRQIQNLLSQAGGQYLKDKGTTATGVEDLFKAGLITANPTSWPLDELEQLNGEKDIMIALPDGTFRSRILARMETLEHLDLLTDGIILYRRFHNAVPEDLNALAADDILRAIPTPPLAALGQKYEYDAEFGTVATTHADLLDAPVVSEPREEPLQ